MSYELVMIKSKSFSSSVPIPFLMYSILQSLFKNNGSNPLNCFSISLILPTAQWSDIESLWPSNSIWWHISRSILARVMAYCLTVLIQQKVLKPLICIISLKIILLKLLTHHSGVNELIHQDQCFSCAVLTDISIMCVSVHEHTTQSSCQSTGQSGFSDSHYTWLPWLNSLRPRQNGRHFADDTFKRIFLNEIVRISLKIS